VNRVAGRSQLSSFSTTRIPPGAPRAPHGNGQTAPPKPTVRLFARALDNLAEAKIPFHVNPRPPQNHPSAREASFRRITSSHALRYNETPRGGFHIRAAACWAKSRVLEELLRTWHSARPNHLSLVTAARLPVMIISIIKTAFNPRRSPKPVSTLSPTHRRHRQRHARFLVRARKSSALVPSRIRALFASYGLTLLRGIRMRTDRLTIQVPPKPFTTQH